MTQPAFTANAKCYGCVAWGLSAIPHKIHILRPWTRVDKPYIPNIALRWPVAPGKHSVAGNLPSGVSSPVIGVVIFAAVLSSYELAGNIVCLCCKRRTGQSWGIVVSCLINWLCIVIRCQCHRVAARTVVGHSTCTVLMEPYHDTVIIGWGSCGHSRYPGNVCTSCFAVGT